MKKILLFIAFTILYQNLLAQYSIKGKLQDCNKNKTIENANIFLNNHKRVVASTTTDEKGKFKFRNLKAGNYTLSFKSKYHLELKEEINITKGVSGIELCYDNLEYDLDTITTPFDYLNNQDTVIISLFTTSCFGVSREKFILVKQEKDFLFSYFQDDSLVNTSTAENMIDQLNGLLIEGTLTMYTGSHGCTTANYYSIFINNNLVFGWINRWKLLNKKDIKENENDITFYDATCDWNGFYKFKRYFKNKSKGYQNIEVKP